MTDDQWVRMNPREFLWVSDQREINCMVISALAPNAWRLTLNDRFIATFCSWEDARDAAPMLFSLHKDQS
jgi:hypothetical protein